VTTSTTTPQQAVIAAFIASQQAYEHALLTMNPADPSLEATTTGAELAQLEGFISNLKAGGNTAHGQDPLDQAISTVTSYNPPNAVVHSCFPIDQVIYGPNGQPLPTALGHTGISAFIAVMVQQAGSWKVQSSTVTSVQTCAAS
jgi:hypothetical protein